jgi:hypothetical protein
MFFFVVVPCFVANFETSNQLGSRLENDHRKKPLG